MPTMRSKALIVWEEELLVDVTIEAQIEGVSRSEWIREACRQRIARQDRQAAQELESA